MIVCRSIYLVVGQVSIPLFIGDNVNVQGWCKSQHKKHTIKLDANGVHVVQEVNQNTFVILI